MHSSSVTLVAPSIGAQQSFSVDHAERLLRMPNGSWTLPADSDWEYSPATGLHKKKKAQRTTVHRKPGAK